jgi:hypothetical protein
LNCNSSIQQIRFIWRAVLRTECNNYKRLSCIAKLPLSPFSLQRL